MKCTSHRERMFINNLKVLKSVIFSHLPLFQREFKIFNLWKLKMKVLVFEKHYSSKYYKKLAFYSDEKELIFKTP